MFPYSRLIPYLGNLEMTPVGPNVNESQYDWSFIKRRERVGTSAIWRLGDFQSEDAS